MKNKIKNEAFGSGGSQQCPRNDVTWITLEVQSERNNHKEKIKLFPMVFELNLSSQAIDFINKE